MRGLEIEEIGAAADLDALAPEWDVLFRSAPSASPFQSPAWLLAWRRTFLAQELWTLGVREGGRLVALLPMFIHSDQDGRRQLTLLGNGVSDRLDLLCEPQAAEAACRAVFAHLADRAQLWDCADFRDLPAASPLLRADLPGAMQGWSEAEDPCPARPLPESADAIVASLPRKRRENLNRRRRRLAELGALEVRTADAGSRAAMLDELLRLHGRRWESRGQAGVLADAAVQAFHAAASEALLAAGLLQLQTLSLEGRVIAAHYGLQRGLRAYSYIHGFDPDFASHAPSTVLLVEAMGEAARRGARTFDFLRGREPYKYDLGGEDRPQFRLRLRRRPASG